MKVHKIEPRNYDFRLTFTYWFNERGRDHNFLNMSFCRTENSRFRTLRATYRFPAAGPLSNRRNMRSADTMGSRRCGLLRGEMVGPFWFIAQNGQFTNVNQDADLDMLQTKRWPNLSKRRNLRHIWFMQNGGRCHTTQ